MVNNLEIRRLELQSKLEELLDSKHVYFQPPESIRLEYPAIVYSRQSINNRFADDIVYNQNYIYQITIIDYDPDSKIANELSLWQKCRHDRQFASDNLNHYVFTLYD